MLSTTKNKKFNVICSVAANVTKKTFGTTFSAGSAESLPTKVLPKKRFIKVPVAEVPVPNNKRPKKDFFLYFVISIFLVAVLVTIYEQFVIYELFELLKKQRDIHVNQSQELAVLREKLLSSTVPVENPPKLSWHSSLIGISSVVGFCLLVYCFWH